VEGWYGTFFGIREGKGDTVPIPINCTYSRVKLGKSKRLASSVDQNTRINFSGGEGGRDHGMHHTLSSFVLKEVYRWDVTFKGSHEMPGKSLFRNSEPSECYW
jgi:hypothetical protein